MDESISHKPMMDRPAPPQSSQQRKKRITRAAVPSTPSAGRRSPPPSQPSVERATRWCENSPRKALIYAAGNSRKISGNSDERSKPVLTLLINATKRKSFPQETPGNMKLYRLAPNSPSEWCPRSAVAINNCTYSTSCRWPGGGIYKVFTWNFPRGWNLGP